jgi:hypothetical protein
MSPIRTRLVAQSTVRIDTLRRNIMAASGPRGPNAARALCKESQT